jgi:hypothetical protein
MDSSKAAKETPALILPRGEFKDKPFPLANPRET